MVSFQKQDGESGNAVHEVKKKKLLTGNLLAFQELVGSLLVGYTQNLISRSLYNQIRSILNTLCQLKIPAWATVRRPQQRIRMHLQMEIIMKASVWGMPCAMLSSKRALQMVSLMPIYVIYETWLTFDLFCIQELANPLVAPFLDFYPKDTNGRDQFKLSQCQKWLELPSNLRPKMCVSNTKHLYIFEPAQTHSQGIVVPIFFYIINAELCAKCICPTVQKPFRLIIPGSIEFSDPNLLIINVKQFCQNYSEIKINGQLLSTLCGNQIYENKQGSLQSILLPNPW
jgi:hypothetical protein